jgi:hypothetical protein
MSDSTLGPPPKSEAARHSLPGEPRPDFVKNSSTHLNSRNPYQAQAQQRLRRQRQVEHVCCTPRLMFELLEELGRHHDGIADDIDRRLERYAGLDLVILAEVGGDRFPTSPLRAIGGGR